MPCLHILHGAHRKDWSATERVLFILVCMQFRFICARAITLGLKKNTRTRPYYSCVRIWLYARDMWHTMPTYFAWGT